MASCNFFLLLTDAFVGFENSEVEDLFPPDFIADVVDRFERRPEVSFGDVVKSGKPIVPQVMDWAKTNGIELVEGWKVEISRNAKKRAFSRGLKSFSADVVERWIKLFTAFEAT